MRKVKSRYSRLADRIYHTLEDADRFLGEPVERVRRRRELARMANLTYGTVWRIEDGHPQARTSTIRKLAWALGVEPRVLLKGGK